MCDWYPAWNAKSKLKERTWTPAYIMLTSLVGIPPQQKFQAFQQGLEIIWKVVVKLVFLWQGQERGSQKTSGCDWCLDWVKKLLAQGIQGIHIEKVPTVKSRRLMSHYSPTRQQHILWESIYGMLSIRTWNNFNMPVSLWKRKHCT